MTSTISVLGKSASKLPPISSNKSIGSISPELNINNENKQTYPITENKKRAPEKIQIIDPCIILKASHIVRERSLDTPVTIDILSESDRFSRQSLDPLNTARESNFSTVSSVSLFDIQ